MLARIVGIILGLILATSGYVVAGWGKLGSWATNLDLGPFEPHRPFAGGAAAILGGVLLVAALTPRPKPKPRKKAPAALGFDLETPAAAPVSAPAEPAFHAEPAVARSAPSPMATPVLDMAAAPTLQTTAVQAPPTESFAQLRERMVALSRAESWADAARALMAMKVAARRASRACETALS
jgi:hypothetical protein